MADITPDEEGLFVTPSLDDTNELKAVPDVPKYLMPDRVYDVLKWLVVVVLPALSTLVAHIGDKVGIQDPKGTAVVIIEIALFFGTCIGASQISSMGR